MRTLLNPVDRLAYVKAQIADLKKEEDELKQELISLGIPVIEGALHRAAVSLVEGRTIIDWEEIAKKLEPSRQLVTAHTRQCDPYYNVRVSARKV